ncbi:MAG TPA: hypothetical protein VHE56_07885 [Mycobacteriales bacterium]|nr:hypothetical protein [Mycobacteriales bacterium]
MANRSTLVAVTIAVALTACGGPVSSHRQVGTVVINNDTASPVSATFCASQPCPGPLSTTIPSGQSWSHDYLAGRRSSVPWIAVDRYCALLPPTTIPSRSHRYLYDVSRVIAEPANKCRAMGLRTRALELPGPVDTAAIRPLVISDCRDTRTRVYKPGRFVVACGGDAIFTLRGVRYQDWGLSAAHAVATQRYNSCVPDCASGKEISRSVEVTLFDPRISGGLRLFGCLVVTGGTGESYRLLGQVHVAACKVRGHIEG